MKANAHRPKIYIVGTNQLQYDLLSFCLENELRAECVLHSDLPADYSEDTEIERQIVWLFDCLDLETSELEERFGDFSAVHSNHIRIALFNVEPTCKLDAFIKQNRIRGIFFKNESRDIFIKGIRAIMDGSLWLSRKMLSDCIMMPHEQLNPFIENMKTLSSREKVILQSVASGDSNQQIADKLEISVHTVKTHLYKIYRKLNVPNRLQATLWANACPLKVSDSQKSVIFNNPSTRNLND